MDKQKYNEVVSAENLRIKTIVSLYNHDEAVDIIGKNYRIYLNALRSLKVSHKSSVVRSSWLVTILVYRKLFRDFGIPFGASSV